MGKTAITVLCENRAIAKAGIIGEHGFSVLIEKDGDMLLLDTGQGLGLKTNSTALNIRLSDIKKIVLSHGHFDHTGGLEHFIPQKKPMDIYAHPDIFLPKYVRRQQGKKTMQDFIGMRLSQRELEIGLNARFHFKKEFSEIAKGIFFSGQIPRKTAFEKSDNRLLTKQGASFIQDPLWDDAALLIETSSGPIILSGCAHSGIVNILNHFSQKSGHRSFHAVIGGTHLGFLHSPDQLEKTMDAFEHYNLKRVAVSHCTGNRAAAACYNRFKDKFTFANAGWAAQF